MVPPTQVGGSRLAIHLAIKRSARLRPEREQAKAAARSSSGIAAVNERSQPARRLRSDFFFALMFLPFSLPYAFAVSVFLFSLPPRVLSSSFSSSLVSFWVAFLSLASIVLCFCLFLSGLPLLLALLLCLFFHSVSDINMTRSRFLGLF